MALFYVHETDMRNRPKGFVPNALEPLLFAEAEGWERRTEHMQDLPTGFHRYEDSSLTTCISLT